MFLVFNPGQTKSSMLWDDGGKGLEVGKDIPAGSVAQKWEPVNGDRNLDNYELVNGEVVYSPPPPPPPPVKGMDLLNFNALFLQGYIEGVFTQSQLIDAELAQKITDEQYRNAWLRGLIGNGSPEQQKRLFEIAEACNIPLPLLVK